MSDYQPIENYGVIGDLETVALVGMDGSIDFLCFPRFDSPSVFAALLDHRTCGRFQIAPLLDETHVRRKQLYLPDSNLLLSRFLAQDGVAEISDLMPVAESGGAHCVVRRAKAVRGELSFRMVCAPDFVSRAFKDTLTFWRRWIGRSTYQGRWRETVNRSALALKLLVSRPHEGPLLLREGPGLCEPSGALFGGAGTPRGAPRQLPPGLHPRRTDQRRLRARSPSLGRRPYRLIRHAPFTGLAFRAKKNVQTASANSRGSIAATCKLRSLLTSTRARGSQIRGSPLASRRPRECSQSLRALARTSPPHRRKAPLHIPQYRTPGLKPRGLLPPRRPSEYAAAGALRSGTDRAHALGRDLRPMVVGALRYPRSLTMTRYVLPDLDYDFGALEPHISGQIMELHHGKHHKSYVEKANETLDRLEDARRKEDFSRLAGLEKALAFNLSGHILHSIFWKNLMPRGGGAPTGDLGRLIERDFGSFEVFKAQMTEVASTVMGSGWATLVWEPIAQRLLTCQIYDHQSNLSQGGIALLVIDAWEHAYYLQYKNQKAAFFDAVWNLWNWKDVAERLDAARRVDLQIPLAVGQRAR